MFKGYLPHYASRHHLQLRNCSNQYAQISNNVIKNMLLGNKVVNKSYE